MAGKISEMTPGSAPTGAELMEAVQGGNTVSLTVDQIAQATRAENGMTYNAPLTGASITIGANVEYLVLEPAGTIATLTVTFPASPGDYQTVTISTTQTVTALTLSGNTGKTIANAVTTLAANGFVKYIYRPTNTKWYRVG